MRKSIFLISLVVLVVAVGSAFYFRAQSIAQFPNIPLEAGQIILPDRHPELPPDTAWVVVQGAEGPIEAPVPLAVPEEWTGKVLVRVEGNVAYFDYAAVADQHAIFAIAVLTEQQWSDEQKTPPYSGEELFKYGGIVYVFSHALDVPYTGAQADEFAQMVSESRQVAESLEWYLTPQP